ncbi:MAG: hypothetical protein GY780_04095 [bacterium]|nr:hypothetical protein [bacterium]
MKARIISLVLAVVFMTNLLAACSDVTGVDDTLKSDKNSSSMVRPIHPFQPVKPIRPQPANTLVFSFDETAPAASTLTMYPSVKSWRLILDARISHQALNNWDINQYKNKATVMGFDGRGNQIAQGTAFVGNPDELDTWYCNITVGDRALDMAQAGSLVSAIVDDIDLGGDGSPLNNGEKVNCWIRALGAAAGVAGSIGAGAAVLAACFGTGGLGCPAAITAYIAVGGGGVVAVTIWYCQCVDETASFC